MRTLLLAPTLALIVFAAYYVSPSGPGYTGNIGIEDVQTDLSTTYPHTASKDRAWFVEATLPGA